MTSQTKQAIFLVILLLVNDVRAKEEEKKDCSCSMGYAVAVVGGVGAMLAAPFLIGELGFGAGGIDAGHGAAIVGAGHLAEAAGIGLAGKGVIGTVAGIVTRALCDCD